MRIASLTYTTVLHIPSEYLSNIENKIESLGRQQEIQGSPVAVIKIRLQQLLNRWFAEANITSCVDQKLVTTQLVSDQEMTSGPSVAQCSSQVYCSASAFNYGARRC